MKKWITFGLIVFLLLSGYVGFTYYEIKHTASEKPPNDVPYIIILGAKVKGDYMSKALLERAETGLKYLQENPQTRVIVTGGKGPDENISEAEAVKRYLLEQGIETNRILIENKSVNTYENLKFAEKLYGVKSAVIVSNDFHLFRALKLSEAQGIKSYPLAAKTPEVVKAKLYAREYLAITKWRITGK
ncbi:YdcF family protein [Bacillus sp. FJAT-49736]|uniref:YdcF family protein n=1 Tax=Bacillus sp. FJAT-49736 TaxID=2833582 RepID=UPI001BC8DE14|nr:YdcF family protein [Bacillus sp. FJAT-49736]MBS4173055.1 YdcF family protein [Bacillus sp. FJAT-49736]